MTTLSSIHLRPSALWSGLFRFAHPWARTLLACLATALFLASCTTAGAKPLGPTLTVHYIDVGQGASTLVQGPDFTILIDAGLPADNQVVPYLQSVGVKSLDLVIGTHPHADHIGQITKVMSAFPVARVWLSGDTDTTRTYDNTISAIEASKAAYHEPRAGETLVLGSAQITVLNPTTLTGSLNDDSVAIRLVYHNVAFIFPGDSEVTAEGDMLASGSPLQAQILQLGHHGSSTASSQPFLDAVHPTVAIYSAGEGNPYGFPHQETLTKLAGIGAKVYGTDVNGTVRVVTDGTTFHVLTQRAGTPVAPANRPVPNAAGQG